MVRNLRLLCDKKQLKKLKLTVLPIVLSLTTVLGGCGLEEIYIEQGKNNDKDKTKHPWKPTTSISSPTATRPSTTHVDLGGIASSARPNNIDLLNKTIVIDKHDMVEINKIIDEEVYYLYSEYFCTNLALQKYKNYNNNNSVVSTNIIVNDKVDSGKLYDSVIKNNKEFIKQGGNSSIYQSYSDSKVAEVCNIVAEAINEVLRTSSGDIDLNVLDYNLSNLKIFSFSRYAYARITEDCCLAINDSLIGTLNVSNAFKKTIVHESMHLIQKRIEPQNAGISYKFGDLSVNPLYNAWYLETSAEKNASFINGEEINYKSEMLYLDGLILASSFNNKRVENINFNNDLNKFNSMFSCDGLISDTELANMMFSIDIILNENDDFLDYYKEKTGKSLSYYEFKDLKNSYKNNFFKILSKNMYHSLCNQKLTLEQAFSIISLYETLCSKVLQYSDSYYTQGCVDFMEYYSRIQQSYFSLIAKKLSISETEVSNMYNYYNENYRVNISGTKCDKCLNDVYSKIASFQTYGVSKVYKELYTKTR